MMMLSWCIQSFTRSGFQTPVRTDGERVRPFPKIAQTTLILSSFIVLLFLPVSVYGYQLHDMHVMRDTATVGDDFTAQFTVWEKFNKGASKVDVILTTYTGHGNYTVETYETQTNTRGFVAKAFPITDNEYHVSDRIGNGLSWLKIVVGDNELVRWHPFWVQEGGY